MDAQQAEMDAVRAIERAVLAYAAAGELDYAETSLLPAYAVMMGVEDAMQLRTRAILIAVVRDEGVLLSEFDMRGSCLN